MERRLILMRHAKSDWESGATSDHARPLNDRGRRDAPRIGARLAELGFWPEAVVSSDATRTRETWELVEHALGKIDANRRFAVCFVPTLYLAGREALAEAVAKHASDAGTVLALGHNPGWEEAGSFLCGSSIAMGTADALLLVHKRGGWREALHKPSSFRLVEHLRPKAP